MKYKNDAVLNIFSIHSRTDFRLTTRRWISPLVTEAASSLTRPRRPPCRGQAAPGDWGRAGPEARGAATLNWWAPAQSPAWTRPLATGIPAPTSASAFLSARPPGSNRWWGVSRPTPLSSLTGCDETKTWLWLFYFEVKRDCQTPKLYLWKETYT